MFLAGAVFQVYLLQKDEQPIEKQLLKQIQADSFRSDTIYYFSNCSFTYTTNVY